MSCAGKRVSLQRLITLSILLIGLLSGTIGVGYAYYHAKHSLRTTIGVSFQELARHSADKVGLMLAKEIEWVERLSALPVAREAVQQGMLLTLDRPELRQWREEQQPYFRSLSIVDRQGRLAGGETSAATRAHYVQQPWWPIVFDQGRPWAGDLLVDESGRGYWEVAVPVRSARGAVLGALKVAIGTDDLFASVLRTRIGRTGHVMLLGQDGQVLVCPVLLPRLHMRMDVSAVRRAPAEAVWEEAQDDTHGGRNGLVGMAPVVLPGLIAQARVWHVLVRQDPKETYAPAFSLMWKLAGFWIVATGLIVLLGSGLANRIVGPLEALVSRVHLLGEGRWTQRLELSGKVASVEIETLVAGFNRLAEQLEAASQETQRYVGELEKTNRELLRSERLASMSQFASMFAHDIRNPLAGMKKTLELLGHRRELQAEPVARLFGDLQFTTELLLGMINDMLDVYQESFSGLTLIPSTFSVNVFLEEMAHLFRSDAEARGVRIRVTLPDRDATITGDRRRLQRVAINLIHNALKYSPPNGEIILSAGEGPEGAGVVIRVEDVGPGVDPAELPYLFEMFHRKKDGYDLRIGRGLGLHFCRLVVEAHHGRIWAANRPEGGAIFSVALPLVGGEGWRSDS